MHGRRRLSLKTSLKETFASGTYKVDDVDDNNDVMHQTLFSSISFIRKYYYIFKATSSH